MDLATMLVMLLFTDGTTEHYVQAERNMGACVGSLGGKTRLRSAGSGANSGNSGADERL